MYMKSFTEQFRTKLYGTWNLRQGREIIKTNFTILLAFSNLANLLTLVFYSNIYIFKTYSI